MICCTTVNESDWSLAGGIITVGSAYNEHGYNELLPIAKADPIIERKECKRNV